MNPKDYLYKLADKWEKEGQEEQKEYYPFKNILDEIFHHSNLRFKDYIQYQRDGEFPARLKKWIDNIDEIPQKKILFKILSNIIFIDQSQMISLHHDSYRRIIVPWISRNVLSTRDLLSEVYEAKILALLRRYSFFSITESFDFPKFVHANNLSGLPKHIVLGEDESNIKIKLLSKNSSTKGLIVFEDCVGTGKQATRVLTKLTRHIPPELPVLFVPLIVLEDGLKFLTQEFKSNNIVIKSPLVISEEFCIKPTARRGEPKEFKSIRALVKKTSRRVLRKNGPHDDPPKDPFGYNGSGALLITCHNSPNNTLPLIHHESPTWKPLFRRIHHLKGAEDDEKGRN